MYIKFVVMFCLFLLTACATTPKVPDIATQNLKNRIDYLEAEVQRKNRKIERLEQKMEYVRDGGITRSEEGATMNTDTRSKNILSVSVKEIQQALKNASFYKGAIDGKMGNQTKEAILNFQKENNLKVDGVVGLATWAKLRKYLK